QRVVLSVEVGEIAAVFAGDLRGKRLAFAQHSRRQPGEPVVEIPEEARLRLLAVARNIDTGLILPPHHLRDALAGAFSPRLLVVELAALLHPHREDDLGRAQEAAGVCRKNAILAISHGT